MENIPPIYSVAEVNSFAADLLENTFMPMWIRGEIGTLTVARSGHVYMTLKDSKAQVRTVWYHGANTIRQMNLQMGSEVEVLGRLSIYQAGGEFQIKIQNIRATGIGNLQKQFEEIKKQLFEEGLFDETRKRKLPFLPRTIGLLTSPDGAALRDFMQILNRRFPNRHVLLYPALVQGKSAHYDLIRGIKFFNRLTGDKRPDILILTRGGGSIEDLWCFNEIILAREIAQSKIPIISAIGHEIDFTIADFVADLRAPTPSAAAELIIQPKQNLQVALDRLCRQIKTDLNLQITQKKRSLDQLLIQLGKHHPREWVHQWQQYLDQCDLKMIQKIKTLHLSQRHKVESLRQKMIHLLQLRSSEQLNRLEHLTLRLHSVNPETQLKRGYAYVQKKKDNTFVSSVFDVEEADLLKIHLQKGEIEVCVQKKINP